MIEETIIDQTPFTAETQTKKFWQNPKTGEVKIVSMDFEPEDETEITLTEKEIRRREEIARKEGYNLGYNTAVEDLKDSEKKEKKTK